METPENLLFPGIFRGHKMVTFARNGLINCRRCCRILTNIEIQRKTRYEMGYALTLEAPNSKVTKMVKQNMAIRRQIANELFKCVWPFCKVGI